VSEPIHDPVEGSTGGSVPAPKRGNVLRGASWQMLAQIAPLFVNLALTPFVITELGRTRYGLWLIASTLTQFFAQFDGGIGRTAMRYFAIYAGANDRRSTGRLLASLLIAISGIMTVTLLPTFIFAASFARFFRTPDEFLPETVFLIKVLVVLVGVGLARNLLASLLNSHHRFAWTSMTLLMAYATYSAGMVFVLSRGMGLRGVAYVFIAQQAVSTLLIVPTALKLVEWRAPRLISKKLAREFANFAWKIQLGGLLNMLSFQGVTLIVGRLAPRQVADFGPGATFSQQLRMIPFNALAPIQARLGQTLGGEGEKSALADASRIQRLWVIFIVGWIGVGAPAAYFGINAWLPLESNLAAKVAATLLAAHFFALIPQVVVQWSMLWKMPEVETVSSLVSVIGTLGLSLILVPRMGAWGVGFAVLVAQAAAFVVIQLMTRRLPVNLPSPVTQIPILPAVLTVAGTVLAELGMGWVIDALNVPQGPFGLLLCGVAAAPMLLGYLIATFGWGRLVGIVRTRLGR